MCVYALCQCYLLTEMCEDVECKFCVQMLHVDLYVCVCVSASHRVTDRYSGVLSMWIRILSNQIC